MATLIPTLESILQFKTKPEEGEIHLLKFLDSHLDDSYEVYFNPYMNGDRPDIVIMKKGQGVLIIEVKDYNLNSYELDERKNWKVKNQNFIIKSPLSQAIKYKDNLYDLHIEKLLEVKIKNIKAFNIVSCAIYFHNANINQVRNLLVEPYKNDRKYSDFLKYKMHLLGRDTLNEMDFNNILRKSFMLSNTRSIYFTDEIYASFKRFLKPPIHLKEQGREFHYSDKQLEIIYESERKEQRIKGVVGSGKTTVLAARAVQAHKRTGGKVLILTYNITLKNYIKDKISQVREEFEWENFVILNYHLFIKTELNNMGVTMELPDDFDKLSKDEKSDFFEREFYSNKQLFIENRDKIVPYNVILIDEIQDYKRTWMEIIKECFLTENGEYVLFGDVKQNIYDRRIANRDVSCNVRSVIELKNCFRSDYKIKDLAIKYQKSIFENKYEIDSFNENNQNLELSFERKQQGSVNYIYLQNTDSVSSLYTIIHENAINKDVPLNDITILGNSIQLLKKFDAYYRYSSNERTNTMFESYEIVFLMGLNYFKRSYKPEWLISGIKLLKRQYDKTEVRAYSQLSVLFTLYDLYIEYSDKFKSKLNTYCEKYYTNTQDFLKYLETYKEEIALFRNEFGHNRINSDIEKIRDNKKFNFYMNSGTVKISTIHSFKGWESDTVFLILGKTNTQMTIDEILYTGITRSRSNLILINYGNEDYHIKMKDLIEQVK